MHHRSFACIVVAFAIHSCSVERPESGQEPVRNVHEITIESAPVDEGTFFSPPASPAATLSESYPDDAGLANDPAVLFVDDFEEGWGKWDSPRSNTDHLFIERDAQLLANGGSACLRSTVTKTDLDAQQYISACPVIDFGKRVDTVYWRFYTRFKGVAPNPHHWVRLAAGDATYSSSGRANTIPPGDKGFWFDFDITNVNTFNFYVYWYKMRSGRCNDGTAVAGCAGDQGTTYYYGNVFEPPRQSPFLPDKWFCVEIMAKTNTVGTHDGELAFWIDGTLIEHYRTGNPSGTWLRASFHTGGCTFSACTPPTPFEGFDFRSSGEVRFKQAFLDAYYERGSFADKKAAMEEAGLVVSDESTIYYDDVVIATKRIGCKVKPGLSVVRKPQPVQ